MNEPKRREQRRTHLDASAVPVERALLARAGELVKEAVQTAEWARERGDEPDSAVPGSNRTPGRLAFMADEFRALADELHYW